MFSAIIILLIMPYMDLSEPRGIQFRPLSKIAFFMFVANFLVLMQLGAKHVESPFIELGQICTVYYFAHFLLIIPSLSLLENSLINLGNEYEKEIVPTLLSSEGVLLYEGGVILGTGAIVAANVLAFSIMPTAVLMLTTFFVMVHNEPEVALPVYELINTISTIPSSTGLTSAGRIFLNAEALPLRTTPPELVLHGLAMASQNLINALPTTPLITIPALIQSPNLPLTESILLSLIRDMLHICSIIDHINVILTERAIHFSHDRLIEEAFINAQEVILEVNQFVWRVIRIFENYMIEYYNPDYVTMREH